MSPLLLHLKAFFVRLRNNGLRRVRVVGPSTSPVILKRKRYQREEGLLEAIFGFGSAGFQNPLPKRSLCP